jgi:hypothetical protein
MCMQKHTCVCTCVCISSLESRNGQRVSGFRMQDGNSESVRAENERQQFFTKWNQSSAGAPLDNKRKKKKKKVGSVC